MSATTSCTKPLGHIEHVIVLMFENRSFDNVLGALYRHGPNFNGIPPKFTNPLDIDGRRVYIPAWSTFKDPDNTASIMPFPDPNEAYKDMQEQIAGGAMTGFANNYAKALKGQKVKVTIDKVRQIMHYYRPYRIGFVGKMPITTMLAKQYAVSDAYFGSGPVQTWPNRLFAHCGTPGNHGDKAYLNNEEYPRYPLMEGYLKWKTVFQQLDEAHGSSSKKAWKVYFDGEHPISATLDYVYNHYNKIESGGNVSYFETSNPLYTDFFKDLKAGKLPKYSFIEPRYQAVSATGFVPPNSNHPGSAYAWDSETPISVVHGELMLQKVYNALKAQPELFKKTLLMVTYDEHGGLFDHVAPPKAVSPFKQKMSNFNYDVYGPRVPAIFINPYITPGTVLRPPAGTCFDHTSIIATLREQFCLSGSLTARDAAAPVFAGLIQSNMKKLNPGPGRMPDMSKLLSESAQQKAGGVETPTPEQLEAAFGTVAYAVYYTAFLSKNKKKRGDD